MLGRRYSYARDLMGGCFTCQPDYVSIWHGPNAQGVATRHHDATGHTTWVDVNMSIRYGDDHENKDKTAMFDAEAP